MATIDVPTHADALQGLFWIVELCRQQKHMTKGLLEIEAHALDTLSEIAGMNSPEVDEGGMMPEEPSAVDLWKRNRALLKEYPVGHQIARLEEFVDKYPDIAPRLRAVIGSLVTASESYFAEIVRTKTLPRRQWP